MVFGNCTTLRTITVGFLVDSCAKMHCISSTLHSVSITLHCVSVNCMGIKNVLYWRPNVMESIQWKRNTFWGHVQYVFVLANCFTILKRITIDFGS